MKRLIALLCIAFFLGTGSAAYAADSGTIWKLVKTKAGTDTILTITAGNQLDNTTGMELGIVLPAGISVKEIQALYKNEDGSFPDCHVITGKEVEDNTINVYCVNRKNQMFQPDKELFRLVLTGSASLTENNTKITYVKTVNRELDESVLTEGMKSQFQDKSGGSENNGSNSSGGSGSSGQNSPGTGAGRQELVQTSKVVTDPVTKEKSIVITAEDKTAGISLRSVVYPKTKKTEAKAFAIFYLNPTTFQSAIPIPDERFLGVLKKVKEENGLKEPFETSMVLPVSTLIKEIESNNNLELLLNVAIPAWMENGNTVKLTEVQLPKEVLETAKKQGKTIKIAFLDTKGVGQFSWAFDAKSLKDSKRVLQNTNLYIQVKPFKQDTVSGILLDAEKVAAFGAQAQLTLFHTEKFGFKGNANASFYGYHAAAKKQNSLGNSTNYKIQKDGSVTVDLVAEGDYVLLTKKANGKDYVSLLSQIAAPKAVTLTRVEGKAGKAPAPVKKKLGIKLPETIQITQKLSDQTGGSAYGAVTVSYQSSDEAVVSVDKQGILTGKKQGTATIQTAMKLYNGKSKIFTTKVTVN